MDLHRAAQKPGWELVAIDKRNFWQRSAAATRGILAPANIISVIGLLLVIAGLIALAYSNYLVAVTLVAVGRLFDILDGWIAAKTGTKSELGAAVDVVIDKTGTFMTAIALFLSNIAPTWLLTLIVLPQIIIMLFTLVLRAKDEHMNVSRAGKYNLALLWISLLGLIVYKSSGSSALGVIAYAVSAVSIMCGIYTVAAYLRPNSRPVRR